MAGVEKSSSLTLFGGEEGWNCDDWTASDDSVRGGQSESFLDCEDHYARFYGTLDTETLGGAGFASQRTTGEDREWDLSSYVGISLAIKAGDKKRYTFILKDELRPKDPATGREQATISWECDFELPPQTKPGETHDRSVFIPWESLNPTYRGKVKKDAEPLDTSKIKRMSIMMRSFFGAQSGDFSLSITKIAALSSVPKTTTTVFDSTPSYPTSKDLEAGAGASGESYGAEGSRIKVFRQAVIALLGAAAVSWLVWRALS